MNKCSVKDQSKQYGGTRGVNGVQHCTNKVWMRCSIALHKQGADARRDSSQQWSPRRLCAGLDSVFALFWMRIGFGTVGTCVFCSVVICGCAECIPCYPF